MKAPTLSCKSVRGVPAEGAFIIVGRGCRAWGQRGWPARNAVDVRLPGMKDRVRGTDLGDPPADQDGEQVRHRTGEVEVVRHDHRRLGRLPRLEAGDQLGDQPGIGRVEPRGGLVVEHQLRLEHQRAGDPDPLAHAARQLRRQLVVHVPQAHQLQHRVDPRGHVGLGEARCSRSG